MWTDLGKPAPLHLRRLFLPLEIAYDYDALKASVSRERISQRPPNMWRYSELLPLPQSFTPRLPVGLHAAVCGSATGGTLERNCCRQKPVHQE